MHFLKNTGGTFLTTRVQRGVPPSKYNPHKFSIIKYVSANFSTTATATATTTTITIATTITIITTITITITIIIIVY